VKAVVVYESLWGNTAAVARAIAEGIGPDTMALTTDEATPEALAGVDLVVAGAPVMGFRLGDDRMRTMAAGGESDAPLDVAHPSMRSWLYRLPAGHGRSASFETRIWWSPGGATGAISKGLSKAGYRSIAKGEKFIVKGKYGPLREGEIERARRWGETLKAAVSGTAASAAA
jgi:hypothetical protein